MDILILWYKSQPAFFRIGCPLLIALLVIIGIARMLLGG